MVWPALLTCLSLEDHWRIFLLALRQKRLMTWLRLEMLLGLKYFNDLGLWAWP